MIVVAKVGGAHGLSGEVRVRFFSDDPEECCARGPLYPADDQGVSPWRVRTLRQGNTMAIVQFEGIRNRAAAEKLNGTLLYQPRECFPDPLDDEYYYADLVGMRVIRADDQQEIGAVTEVFSSGASDILVVRGVDGKCINIPFINQAVPVVDKDTRTIAILPEFIP
ncbi:MAG TPA: ribosome maturation factor RimM [Spirochaetota bacterium]|nr:ribosome maturation factor RimM [Spirochaetota bacterium]HPH01535.1 ribosome maturation factor RimM [Spirochaetota bacterium]HPN82478.1 ribosome maturation factor RimM [Spirochaetota bacterium]